jgi:oligogalacturonide lyase
VDQRIWGLDVQTGRTWPIRRQEGDVSIGHEYWLADGERLGYHGRFRPHLGPRPHIYGTIRWDGTGAHEVQFPYDSMHFHSLDERLIVGDGTPNGSPKSGARPFIQLFRRDRDVYAGPKLLAVHRSTFNDQHAHPHPRFTPDGKAVLYSSDLTGYANLYVVEVGDFDSLPDVAELDPTT